MATTTAIPEISFKGFETLGSHCMRVLTMGIALCFFGVLAFSLAAFTTLATVFVLGAVLIAAGIAQAIHAFSARHWSGFFLQLIACIFYIVAGYIMLTRPAASAVSLTLFLAAFFMVTGAFRAVSATFTHFPKWGWSLLSGLINIALGFIVINTLPLSGLTLIGILLGVEMLFHGISIIALAFAVRRLTHDDSSKPWSKATPARA